MAYQKVVFYPDSTVIDPLRAEYRSKGYKSLSQYLEDIIAGKVIAGTNYGPGTPTNESQPTSMGMAQTSSRTRKAKPR